MAINKTIDINYNNQFTNSFILDNLTLDWNSNIPITISTPEFETRNSSNRDYIKMKIRVDSSTTARYRNRYWEYQLVSCEYAQADANGNPTTNYTNFNLNQDVDKETDTEVFLTSAYRYYEFPAYCLFRLQFQEYVNGTVGGVENATIFVIVRAPQPQRYTPFTFSYSPTVQLSTNGSIGWTFSVTNTNRNGIKVYGIDDGADDPWINFTTEQQSYSFSYTFVENGNRQDIGEHSFYIEPVFLNTPDGTAWVGPNSRDISQYIYWYDENNVYHSAYGVNGIYRNKRMNREVRVQDNTAIFSLVGTPTIASKKASAHGQSLQWYLKDAGCVQLNVSFSYTASGSNTFTVKLRDISRSDGNTFISYQITKTSPATTTLTLYSEQLTTAQSVIFAVEVTDSYNRKLEYQFSTPIVIYDYNKPKIRKFDAYFSSANGTLDLQSTYYSALTSFEWTPLNGGITLTQSMTVNGTTFNPAFVSGTRKYFNNVTLPVATNAFNIVFTITDSIGGSDSVTFRLARNGGTLMDFNNNGYGMAIGKDCERNGLEINMPVMFFNQVRYVDGSRQTSDAAHNLGFMDTYNTGCRTIQEILDYLVVQALS